MGFFSLGDALGIFINFLFPEIVEVVEGFEALELSFLHSTNNLVWMSYGWIDLCAPLFASWSVYYVANMARAMTSI